MLGIYIKPLFEKKKFEKLFEKILDRRLKQSIGRAGVKAIKDAQKQSMEKGSRIRKGIHFTVGRRSVTFYLNDIGGYHNYGVRKHKMRYLTKATRPIPLTDKNTGKLIFRWASKKSMRKPGSWTHPGMKPKNFLKKGVEAAKAEFRERLKKRVTSYLKKGR